MSTEYGSIIKAVPSSHAEHTFKNIAICSCCKKFIPFEIRTTTEIIFPENSSSRDQFKVGHYELITTNIYCNNCGERAAVLQVPSDLINHIKAIMENSNIRIYVIRLSKIFQSGLNMRTGKCTKCTISPPIFTFEVKGKSFADTIFNKSNEFIDQNKLNVSIIYNRILSDDMLDDENIEDTTPENEQCFYFSICGDAKSTLNGQYSEDDIDYFAMDCTNVNFIKFIENMGKVISDNQ